MIITNPFLALTVASLKMWFRDRQAIFWTFFLPLVVMVIFGMLDFGNLSRVDLGVVDQAQNEASRILLGNLENTDAFDLSASPSEAEERLALANGDREVVLIIPPGFAAPGGPKQVQVLFDDSEGRPVQVGRTIINQALDEMTFAVVDVAERFTADGQPVTSRRLRFIDFLMPGVVAMSIMQMGLFSVAFSFVQLKNRGVLRRLLATPAHPSSFLFGQVFTRLTISILQTLVLIGVAVVLFDVELAGNLGAILVLAVMGGGVFVSIGFAVSGWARSEEVAAPLANVIALPMMFLSGVFFPRSAMPGPLEAVTGYLPLTYLIDAMRNVATDGEALWSQGWDILGLAVWLALSFLVAVRLFRWE